MTLGTRAWEGLNLLVYGREPILPMQLEQFIAAAYPAGEVRLESFEDYNDALDFTKSERKAGFIFLINDDREPSMASVLNNLAEGYQTTGWPAMATLIRAPRKCDKIDLPLFIDKRIVNYCDFENFSNPESCQTLLNQLWTLFVDKTTDHLLPGRTQTILLNLARKYTDPKSFAFRERLLNLITPSLDLSWRDLLVMRWAPIVQTVHANAPEALSGQNDLISIFAAPTSQAWTSADLPKEVANKSVPLVLRLAGLINSLEEARASGNLEAMLTACSALAKPGAPALLRILKARSLDINRISQELIRAA